MTADAILETEHGAPIARFRGMRFARTDRAAFESAEDIAWRSLRARLGARCRTSARMRTPRRPGPHCCSPMPVGPRRLLASWLTELGGDCWSVRAGAAFARTSERSWIIDPANPEHYRRLWAEAPWGPTNPLPAIVHCWSLDVAVPGDFSSHAWNDDDVRAFGSILHIVQALAHMTPKHRCPLTLVTRDCRAVTGPRRCGRVVPASGGWPMWSPSSTRNCVSGRSTSMRPKRRDDVVRLATELLAGTEARVALRGLQRWVPRLLPYRPPAARESELRECSAVPLGTGPAGQFRRACLASSDAARRWHWTKSACGSWRPG